MIFDVNQNIKKHKKYLKILKQINKYNKLFNSL